MRRVAGRLIGPTRRVAPRGLAWPSAEVVVALLAAGATGVAVHALVVAAGFRASGSTAPGLGPVWAAAMLALAAGAVLVQRRGGPPIRTRLVVALLAGAAAAVAMVPLMAGLLGTDQPLYTILHGDMAFRTENVTRFAASWRLQDYTFRGLDAFYPPAWFWLAGRSAHVLGVTPWQVVKPFTILTIAAALLVAYWLWRTVLSPAGALAAAVGSSLVLPVQVGLAVQATQAWYSPYSCFVAVTGVAWLAAAAHVVRRDAGWGRLAVLAVVGAVLALTYYLLFVLLVVVLIALALWPAAGRRRALVRTGALCGAVAVLTAVFWVPLLGAVLHGGASQGHFLRPDFLRVALGIDGSTALAVLAVVAIAALAASVAGASIAARAVAALLIGTVLYQLLSVAGLLFVGEQLQPHRAVTMMWATFGAAVPVALDGLRTGPWPARLVTGPALRAGTAVTLALAVPATFALGAALGSDLAAGPLTQVAHARPDLTQTQAVSRFITTTTGRRPQQLTVLSADKALLVTEPYYGFVSWDARYAHPAAHLKQRVAVLRAAAACPTPACTTRVLSGSRFGPIDALVLIRTPFGARMDTQVDGFPDPVLVSILFRPASFAPATWARRVVRNLVVYARRA